MMYCKKLTLRKDQIFHKTTSHAKRTFHNVATCHALRTIFHKNTPPEVLRCSSLSIQTQSYIASVRTTDLYKLPDAVPPIHAVSSHVATDKDPSKFRSIFSDNLQPIATRGKKAHGTLLVDIGCSSKRAPPPLVITTKLAAAIYGGAVVSTRYIFYPVLPLWLGQLTLTVY